MVPIDIKPGHILAPCHAPERAAPPAPASPSPPRRDGPADHPHNNPPLPPGPNAQTPSTNTMAPIAPPPPLTFERFLISSSFRRSTPACSHTSHINAHRPTARASLTRNLCPPAAPTLHRPPADSSPSSSAHAACQPNVATSQHRTIAPERIPHTHTRPSCHSAADCVLRLCLPRTHWPSRYAAPH